MPTGIAAEHAWIGAAFALILLVGAALFAIQAVIHRRALGRLRRELGEHEFNEERLAMALDASDAAQWECDIPASHFTLSDRYYEQLGYAPGAFPATMRAWRELLHPDDAPLVSDRIRQALLPQASSFLCEYRMRDAQGEWRWLLSRGRVLRRGPRGEALLMMGTHQDIHASRIQADAQRELQERFRQIYETTPDVMGVVRRSDGCYVDVNASYERVTGFSRHDAIGNSPLSLGIWAIEQQRVAYTVELERKGHVDSIEMTVRRKEGELVEGLLSVRPLVMQGEDSILFIYRDITERRRMERETAQAHAEVLRAAAANQAKSDFLSRMSHELRTPLNAVLGFAQLLREAPLLAPPEAELERSRVEAILNAGWHLLNLIDDVLDISRIETGQMQVELQPLCLREVLDAAVELVKPQAAAAGIKVDLGGPDALRPVLMGDPLRLRQSLVNLLSNAIKYNRPGGLVSVEGLAREGRYQLHIIDSGQGMNEQQMAHLFEPFNRLGREREGIDGTGIGLVLTRHLVELMGGILQVSSREGEGTTVSLDLPLASEEAASSLAACAALPEPASSAPALLPERRRVLYIEDKPSNQLIVQAALQAQSHLELHLAGDGAEGLRRAAELLPDLILLDMRLPDTDGLEVLARLRAEPALAAIQVVALSASAMPEEVARAKQAGALEYWTKPIHLERFLDDLKRVLG